MTFCEKLSTIRIMKYYVIFGGSYGKRKRTGSRLCADEKGCINDYSAAEGDFFIIRCSILRAVREDEDFTFLCYWTDEGKKIDAVVVKKSGTPMIYKTKDYTMVVAIDCVKIGFIFRNGKNQTQQ